MKRKVKVYGTSEQAVARQAENTICRTLITSLQGFKYCYGTDNAKEYEVTIKVKEK